MECMEIWNSVISMLYPITTILKVLDLGNLPLQVGIVDLWVK